MRLVSLADCKAGEILAEEIVNRYGAVILAENTILNNYIIHRLNELGVQRIKIYRTYGKNNCRDARKAYHRIQENYREGILCIKSLINELAVGKSLDAERIISISNMVCSGLNDGYNVLAVINNEKSFDEYTYSHSLNVAFYSMLIGKWTGLLDESIRNIIYAGLLHDIGKTKVPLEILNKKSRLCKEEFEIIKKHTHYGYEMIKSIGYFPERVCKAVLLHHERMDKSGYPFGIGGEQINFYARIIAVADVYDAMTSDRVYKKRATPFEVFEMFKTIGVKNFDPGIVNIFLTNLSAYYVGSKVRLNTGEIGEVAYIPPHSITEPVINIGHDYIDMAHSRNRNILCMV